MHRRALAEPKSRPDHARRVPIAAANSASATTGWATPPEKRQESWPGTNSAPSQRAVLRQRTQVGLKRTPWPNVALWGGQRAGRRPRNRAQLRTVSRAYPTLDARLWRATDNTRSTKAARFLGSWDRFRSPSDGA